MVHIPHRNRSEAIYGPPGEPLEIGKHGRDEFLSARILRSQRGSKEIEKIAGPSRRLPANLPPVRQSDGIPIHPAEDAKTFHSPRRRPAAAEGRWPSGGHPAVLIKIDRFVRHDSSALCSDPHSANPMT